MKTRLNGTERPKKDAGGLRHGLLVLAVLLLTCVLMAGAVSAADLTSGTLGSWNKDRAEPYSWTVSDDTILFTVNETPNNEWAAWQGKKAMVNNVNFSNHWEVESTLTLDPNYENPVAMSLWIQVDGISGAPSAADQNAVSDWSILRYYENNWETWNSTGEGSWESITTPIPAADSYALKTVCLDGIITQYINGESVHQYSLDLNGFAGKLTAPSVVILNSYSYGEKYTTTWTVPTVKFSAGPAYGDVIGVSTIEELKDALEGDKTYIALAADIVASEKIGVNRDVTIDGNGYTISADTSLSGTHLLGIGDSGSPVVTIKDVTLDSRSTAKGVNAFTGPGLPPAQVTLEQVKLLNSAGSGLTVNGADVSAVGIFIGGSDWDKSVDVGFGNTNSDGRRSSFGMDPTSTLEDPIQISTDDPDKLDQISVTAPGYTQYVTNDETASPTRGLWATTTPAGYPVSVTSSANAVVNLYPTVSSALTAADAGDTVKLLETLTLDAPITIKKAITFDGNGKEITAEGNTLTVVADITGPVTIKNVVATISTSTTNPNLDSPINIMSPVVMENNLFDITNFNNEAGDTVAVILTAGAEGSTLKGTQIIMGSADNTGVQGIAVYGNEVTISGSTITTTALQNDDKSTGIYTVGVGDITITDNTFVSEAENGAGNRGIMVYNPTADAGQSITITDNTFDLAAGAGDTAGAVVAVSSDDDSKNTVNLDVTKNTVTAAARGVYLVSDVTVTGDVAGNDFRAIPEESQIATAEGVEPNVENLHTGNNDAPVDPQPTPLPPSGGSSGSGNMNNAYRVLFNDGATTLSVQTDLSSGDKLTKPETPVKDGYTFAGWYKDSACTQGWDFETGISGDMTLYAKWTAAGSSGETEATATPTKTQTAVTTPQPTKTQTAAATTSAPEATTAAGVSPTLTQAPAPVAGALFGLLAAGVLLRRRFQ